MATFDPWVVAGYNKAAGYGASLQNSWDNAGSGNKGAMGYSTPWGKGGITDDPLGWLSGQTAFNDLTKMNAPALNSYKAGSYQADPNAYRLEGAHVGAAQMNLRPQNQVRGDQASLVNALQARAAGRAPSAAELQLRSATDSNIAAAQSASVGSSNPALAARAAIDAGASMNQQSANQAAVLRAQEQAQAEAALGNALMGMRGQDIGVSSTQAGFNQQAGIANQQSAIAQMNAQMERERLAAMQFQQAQQINADIARQNAEAQAKSQSGALGAAGSAIGGFLGM